MGFNEEEIKEEYYAELKQLTAEFAKKYKLKIKTIADVVSDEPTKGVSEMKCENIREAWADCALELADKIGDKHSCFIEHEETLVTITPFSKSLKNKKI